MGKFLFVGHKIGLFLQGLKLIIPGIDKGV